MHLAIASIVLMGMILGGFVCYAIGRVQGQAEAYDVGYQHGRDSMEPIDDTGMDDA